MALVVVQQFNLSLKVCWKKHPCPVSYAFLRDSVGLNSSKGPIMASFLVPASHQRIALRHFHHDQKDSCVVPWLARLVTPVILCHVICDRAMDLQLIESTVKISLLNLEQSERWGTRDIKHHFVWSHVMTKPNHANSLWHTQGAN